MVPGRLERTDDPLVVDDDHLDRERHRVRRARGSRPDANGEIGRRRVDRLERGLLAEATFQISEECRRGPLSVGQRRRELHPAGLEAPEIHRDRLLDLRRAGRSAGGEQAESNDEDDEDVRPHDDECIAQRA